MKNAYAELAATIVESAVFDLGDHPAPGLSGLSGLSDVGRAANMAGPPGDCILFVSLSSILQREREGTREDTRDKAGRGQTPAFVRENACFQECAWGETRTRKPCGEGF